MEFIVPFSFGGRTYARGGILLVLRDGTRTAMTRSQFRTWLQAVLA